MKFEQLDMFSEEKPGERIRKARMEAGLSQVKAAELLMVPIRTLQDWELRGTAAVYLENLVIEKYQSLTKKKK